MRTCSINSNNPYQYIIKRKGCLLFYFGARHSFDPSHPQFTLLEKFWKQFLKRTGGTNCVVLVEGGLRPIKADKKETIQAGGEGHFITFLAAKAAIQINSPEPDIHQERISLLKRFSKEEIQYYYFARTVNQWHRRGRTPSFAAYLRPFLARDKRVSQWPRFSFSMIHMKAIHRHLFQNTFNENNAQFFNTIVNPTLRATVINRVAATSSMFRDRHIIQEIKKLWATNNLFIVYGRSHAIVHRVILQRFSS